MISAAPTLRAPVYWLMIIATQATLALAQEPAQDSNQSLCDANPELVQCAPSYQLLDWVPYQNLPLEMRGARAEHCQGSYVDPLAQVNTSEDPSEANIVADAPYSELQGQVARFSGGVNIHQGYRRLSSAEAEYNSAEGTGTLRGEVVFREPGLLMHGDSAWLNASTGEAKLKEGQFVVHREHIRGGAALISRRADDIIELDQAYYSYCPPTNTFWQLDAQQLELDFDSGVGTARKAKITVRDTPIFYIPYVEFPIDDRRKSGVLWPEIGKDSSGGLDAALPYYFNLAPNYDLTITPRLVADRGLLTEMGARYLGPYMGYWEVGGSYIDSDDRYRDENPAESGNRWLGTVDQLGLIQQRWRTNIDYTKVSDDSYLNDIGTSSLDIRQSTHLIQRGKLDYLGDNWQAELRLEQFQTIAKDIATNPYKKLPQLDIFRTAIEQDFSVNPLFQSEYTNFEHDTLVTGQRLYNEVGINYPMSWLWGYIKPTAKYRQINYKLDDPVVRNPVVRNPLVRNPVVRNPLLSNGQAEDRFDVGAPLVSLDGGLFFEREFDWAGSNWMQTLEPRLYYLWADRQNQQDLPNFDTSQLTFSYNQIFRETRFSGHDRLDDANQVALGITTRIIDPNTGTETLSASIGQIYYLDDRLVNLGSSQAADFEGSSAIAAEFALAPLENLEFQSSWLWNTDAKTLDESHVRMSYLNGKNQLFNVGYNYRRYRGTDPAVADINQVDFSTYLPVTKHWSLFAQAQYDLDEKDNVNDLVGVEYNSCCWRVRVMYQRSLNQVFGSNVSSLVETKKATFVEFQLKGLGGVGTRVTSVLEEFIRGYKSSDK